MADDEAKRLLKWFDEPFYVGLACYHEFQNKTYWPAQMIMARAKIDGLVIECPGSPPIVNSDNVYKAEAILTDIGRAYCGLKPLQVSNPALKPKPKQGELF